MCTFVIINLIDHHHYHHQQAEPIGDTSIKNDKNPTGMKTSEADTNDATLCNVKDNDDETVDNVEVVQNKVATNDDRVEGIEKMNSLTLEENVISSGGNQEGNKVNMYISMYIYMYICMHIYIYIYIYTYIHVCMYTSKIYGNLYVSLYTLK
jgi:hypothetical protein